MSWIKEQKLLVTSIVVGAICLGFLGVILVDMIDQKNVTSTSSQQVDESVNTTEQEDLKTSEEAIEEVEATENPFNSEKSTLTEDDILNYMHGMSHQKVVAEQKWLHYEMTNERIEYLVRVVESGNYENEEVFLDILNRWEAADFSQADDDHNAIWGLQGGTVGRATGVMTSEQEQQYLEEHRKSIN